MVPFFVFLNLKSNGDWPSTDDGRDEWDAEPWQFRCIRGRLLETGDKSKAGLVGSRAYIR